MRTILIALATAITAAATPAAADYLVKEVGSFHIGGHTETLNGLPSKEIVFSPGAPPIKVDPNGEFEVEQMYVQYVKQAQPKSKLPLLLWHGGGLSGVTWETKPDTASRAGSSSSSMPAMTSTSPMRSSAAAPPGRATLRSSRASRSSGPRRRPGSCSGSGRATRSAASARRSRASNS